MPSFDDAVSGAFGRRPPEESTSVLPPVREVVEPPHDFHGPQLSAIDERLPTIVQPPTADRPRPRGRPLGSKKRHRDENRPPREDRPPKIDPLTGEPIERVPKKKRTDPFSSPEERKEVVETIMRYQAAFPDFGSMVPPDINQDNYSLDHLQFMLQTITQRINQKQELKILQTGLSPVL